jgi:hypothetical protein
MSRDVDLYSVTYAGKKGKSENCLKCFVKIGLLPWASNKFNKRNRGKRKKREKNSGKITEKRSNKEELYKIGMRQVREVERRNYTRCNTEVR